MRYPFLAALLACASLASAWPFRDATPAMPAMPVPTACDGLTTARPGEGHAFRGHLIDDDLGFMLAVPRGHAGWDGVDDATPFHGFTIFLDQRRGACILFEIHRRANGAPAPRPVRDARPQPLGEATGWRSTRYGVEAGAPTVRIETAFSSAGRKCAEDGRVLLVAPAGPEGLASRWVYDEFVGSLRFVARE